MDLSISSRCEASRPKKELPYFVHESAYVDEGAEIGDGTKIWHFSHVMKGARIGQQSIIGQNVNIDGGTLIGNNVKIQNNVSVYTGTVIEDDVFLGPSCVLTNVSNPRSQVNRHSLYETTHLKRGCTIGANATIVCGVTVGRYAFVGAGAVVTKNVPDFALMVGNPARQVGWMSRHGHRLGLPDENGIMRCPETGYRYDEVEPGVLRCLDLDEEAPLPAELRVGRSRIGKSRRKRKMNVPLLDLKAQYAAIKGEVEAAIGEVLESQHFILGPKVEQCEKAIAAYSSCAYGVGVSSGSDALLACLMAEDIGPGDEVITTPYTFFATAGAIARLGATPVFVDIDPETYNIDARQIAAKITRKTRAIIPVHLYGQMADMDPVMRVAVEHKLVVIEDAAQAIGAEYKGRRAGSIGHYGCFSFFPSKNLGAAGDGGMIVTNDAQRAEKLKCLRAHGSKPKYHHKMIGGNFRSMLSRLRSSPPNCRTWMTGPRHGSATRSAIDELFAASQLPVRVPAIVTDRHIFNQYVIRVPLATNCRPICKQGYRDGSLLSRADAPAGVFCVSRT